MSPILARDVPQSERWPLLKLTREVWGPVAAREMAQAMNVVIRHPERSGVISRRKGDPRGSPF